MPIVRQYNDKRVKIFWDILQLPKVNVEVHASPSQFDNDDDGEEDKEVVALNYDISDGIFPKLVMMMMMMMEKRTKRWVLHNYDTKNEIFPKMMMMMTMVTMVMMMMLERRIRRWIID